MRPTSRIALTLNAGFCDTATFIAMGGIFSAHVTGNFVLFAAALAEGISAEDYLKLWTFPVFLLGVALGVVCAGRKPDSASAMRRILMSVLIVLLVIQGINFLAAGDHIHFNVDAALTLLLVVAMAMQNTVHRYVEGPMTTVMTGTVMNTMAGYTQKLMGFPVNREVAQGTQPLILIGGFALGCAAGGFAVVFWQWWSLLVPLVITAAVLVSEQRSDAATE
ncbi:MAG: YoaK family protein [Pseudomonadota bacterium]